jgi:hypothetical protein
VRETGEYGRGAHFEIAVPPGNYRLDGAPGGSLPHGAPFGAQDLRAPPTQR